jgi:hypothetical protein
MVFQISEGVKVSVETYYQPDYSNPVASEFMFAYRITIENNNTFPVKLLQRHWNIFDSNGSYKEIVYSLLFFPAININTLAAAISKQKWVKWKAAIPWKICTPKSNSMFVFPCLK